MTIDRISEKTILVTLTQGDLRSYNLDFESKADSVDTRRGLTGLMIRVGEECGLDHRGKSYLVEALPGKESWLLIISVRREKRRRRYRIKRDAFVDCCRFEQTDDLLDWLGFAGGIHSGSALYQVSGGYYLLPDRPWTDQERSLLSEFGRVTRESRVTAARIREHGSVLCENHRRRHYLRNASNAVI